MEPTLTDWIQAAGTVATAVLALVAVKIARGAPEAAGRFADQYRAASAKSEERDKLKGWVFMMLLKGRRQIVHQDTIAALNVVDFVFHDEPHVRSAYRLFVEETAKSGDAERIVNRYIALTVAVAQAMDYGATITEADMRLGYYPEALGKLDEAAWAEAEEKIARKAKSATIDGGTF